MESKRKNAYQLSESQVSTPEDSISLFWKLTEKKRPNLGSVLDMGAGDCRFAKGGHFGKYVGIEIDKKRVKSAALPIGGRLINNCAFRHRESNYDACIGNPPYVRHHDIESPWKEDTVDRIKRDLGVALNKHGNLYLYFMCLGLLKTTADGLVALIIPYEWVSRPSAKAVRAFIQKQKWEVEVYRFQEAIFDGVLTTASVSIIDKAKQTGRWSYYDITGKNKISSREGIVESKKGVLDYSNRGNVWALRGLSPGSQEIFTLTEGERIHFGLSKPDVAPCITSLKDFPRESETLCKASFRKYYVDAGKRCWLVQSFRKKRSPALDAYLEAVPENQRNTYTCKNQNPWFKYKPHPVPQILFGSAFTQYGPKIVVNSVGAAAVGSAFGIHSDKRIPVRQLQKHLLSIDFEARVVAHAGKLKKIEVKQLNDVLNTFTAAKSANGKSTR